MKSVAQRRAAAETLEQELSLLHAALKPLLARDPAGPLPETLRETAGTAIATARRLLSRQPGAGILCLPRLPPTVADMALLLSLAHARLVAYRLYLQAVEDDIAAEMAEAARAGIGTRLAE